LTFGHSGAQSWAPECPNVKNGGLDQYGAEPFEQQQFGMGGVEGVNIVFVHDYHLHSWYSSTGKTKAQWDSFLLTFFAVLFWTYCIPSIFSCLNVNRLILNEIHCTQKLLKTLIYLAYKMWLQTDGTQYSTYHCAIGSMLFVHSCKRAQRTAGDGRCLP